MLWLQGRGWASPPYCSGKAPGEACRSGALDEKRRKPVISLPPCLLSVVCEIRWQGPLTTADAPNFTHSPCPGNLMVQEMGGAKMEPPRTLAAQPLPPVSRHSGSCRCPRQFGRRGGPPTQPCGLPSAWKLQCWGLPTWSAAVQRCGGAVVGPPNLACGLSSSREAWWWGLPTGLGSGGAARRRERVARLAWGS